MGRLGDKHAGI
jgi:hypothetical protein